MTAIKETLAPAVSNEPWKLKHITIWRIVHAALVCSKHTKTPLQVSSMGAVNWYCKASCQQPFLILRPYEGYYTVSN